MDTANEILDAKKAAGPEAFLWLNAGAGDVILWPAEETAGPTGSGDDGAHAVGRWQVDDATEDALIDSGEVDEIN